MEHWDLTRVHEVNLKLLKEIDRICRKYKIKYMIDSGTLLGAVRHQRWRNISMASLLVASPSSAMPAASTKARRPANASRHP